MMSTKVSTLLFRVDGDASKANRALSSVGKSAGGLGSKIAKVGGLIAAAFSVQKIVQFGKESVQAMMEDQQAAAQLARTLKNVTGARKKDTEAVEANFRALEELTGVEDDKLRPAFSRLVRSTKSLSKSTDLLNLSLDIAAATGKDLGAVANAVSKGYDGNLASLSRLGLSLDKNLMKSKDWGKVQEYLEKVFKGSAKTAANSLAGRLDRMSLAFQNMKEDIGYALLPKLEDLAAWMTETGVPAIQSFIDALTGKGQDKDPVRDSVIARAARAEGIKIPRSLQDSTVGLAEAIKRLFESVGKLFGAFDTGTSPDSGLVAFVDLMTKLVNLTNTLVGALDKAAAGMRKLDEFEKKADDSSLGWILRKILGPNWTAGWYGAITGKKAIGGTVSGGSSYLVGERGPELFTPTSHGYITPNGKVGASGTPVNVTVNVHGSVIRERDLAVSVRDQIAQLMRRQGLNPSILGV
jgi:IS1 family transposase